ncbi:MAG: response regulator transcription factor [Bacteroidales bacterium]|nr:response regulator transcription factor [Bacteroidales bacterium]
MAFKVLVAEDDLLTSKAIEHRLKMDGYEVFKAYNGKIATKILQENVIDIALVDIHMPYVGGFEVIKYIRETQKKTIPIAVVSRIDNHGTIMKAFELGADDYITKPFNAVDLSLRIKTLLLKKK